MRSRWVVGLMALLLVGGCTSRVGGEPSDKPSSSDKSVGAVDLAVPVELSRVVSTTASSSPPVPSTSQPQSATPPASSVPGADGNTYVLDEPFLTIERIEGANVEYSTNGSSQWVLNLKLTKEDGATFGDWTTDHVGEQAAIVIDGEVLVAPTIQSPIPGGDIQVSGNFTKDDVSDLLDKITGR